MAPVNVSTFKEIPTGKSNRGEIWHSVDGTCQCVDLEVSSGKSPNWDES